LRKILYKHRLDVLLSDEELYKLNENTKKLKLKKSVFVRKLLNKDFIYSSLYSEILFELKKQGNNLNQIARQANADKSIGSDVYLKLNKILETSFEIRDMLLKITSKKIW